MQSYGRTGVHQEYCDQLAKEGWVDKIRRVKTGLILDAYFSATKVKWILDNVPGVRKRAEEGKPDSAQSIHGWYGV